MKDSAPAVSCQVRVGEVVVRLSGSWCLARLAEASSALKSLAIADGQRVVLDGEGITALDTSGAFLVLGRVVGAQELIYSQCTQAQTNLFELVRDRYPARQKKPLRMRLEWLEAIGRAAFALWRGVLETLEFFGEVLCYFCMMVFQPRRLRLRELFVQLEQSCVNALPVIGLVTFMIGIVIAYLTATQIEKYGANIFIVDGVALAMSRELSPMIVAVVMAGRSGSAFTAQIGSMKLSQEIDAIQTLGLSPLGVLVIPRILALIAAMPLLVFVGYLVGLAGGVVVADFQLGITPDTFLDRLRSAVPLKHFYVGLAKAPIFAFFIALIGCRMGMTVENNARSVGQNTTSTVVQSIVTVILLDAAFAVVCMELGI